MTKLVLINCSLCLLWTAWTFCEGFATQHTSKVPDVLHDGERLETLSDIIRTE